MHFYAYLKKYLRNPGIVEHIEWMLDFYFFVPKVLTTEHRVHRPEMATFLPTLSHDGIFGQLAEGGGCSTTPFHSFCPSTKASSS